ncbi:MAG: carbonic anhydrase [Polyangiaceae bacterium]
MGASWHEALRSFRRRSFEDLADGGCRALFVLCAEDSAAAALVAACEPACVLQTFGGVVDAACTSTRGTFEHAIRTLGVRHVFVCGHASCAAASEATTPRGDAIAQCRRLERDEVIGPLLRSHGVRLRALWFDRHEGDVYACDFEDRATLVGDADFGRMLDEARSAS